MEYPDTKYSTSTDSCHTSSRTEEQFQIGELGVMNHDVIQTYEGYTFIVIVTVTVSVSC